MTDEPQGHDSDFLNRLLVEQAPHGLVIIDPETARLVEFNEAAHRQLGYSREEFAGLSVFDLEASETQDETRAHIATVLREGRCDFDTRQRTREGAIRDVNVTAQRAEALGRVVLHCVWRDVSARKRAEVALAASEVRYRRLFESAKDGILILDAETGSVDDVNPFLVALLGFSREEFFAKRVWELGFFADLFQNEARFCELKEKGFVRYDDLALESKGGRRIEVEFVSNVYQVNGHRVIQCNIRDVSVRKRAEAKNAIQLKELERWQAVMLGREHRVQELKREVNDLCRRAGLDARYPSQNADPQGPEPAPPDA